VADLTHPSAESRKPGITAHDPMSP